MTVEDRFWRQVTIASVDECWPWTGALRDTGYGSLTVRKGVTVLVHRYAHELLVGPLARGMSVDHLCHNRDPECAPGRGCPHRRCVNPRHLEGVALGVNVLRGQGPSALNARKTHCPAGHPYDSSNTCLSGGRRKCRACARERARASRSRPRAA